MAPSVSANHVSVGLRVGLLLLYLVSQSCEWRHTEMTASGTSVNTMIPLATHQLGKALLETPI